MAETTFNAVALLAILRESISYLRLMQSNIKSVQQLLRQSVYSQRRARKVDWILYLEIEDVMLGVEEIGEELVGSINGLNLEWQYVVKVGTVIDYLDPGMTNAEITSFELTKNDGGNGKIEANVVGISGPFLAWLDVGDEITITECSGDPDHNDTYEVAVVDSLSVIHVVGVLGGADWLSGNGGPETDMIITRTASNAGIFP